MNFISSFGTILVYGLNTKRERVAQDTLSFMAWNSSAA